VQFLNKTNHLARRFNVPFEQNESQGRSARMNSRSAALSFGPDTPVMNARLFIRAD